MVCGIVSIPTCAFYVGVIPGILGLVFGILGLKSNRRGMAVSGIACGTVGILLFLVLVMMTIAAIQGSTMQYDPFEIPFQELFETQAF